MKRIAIIAPNLSSGGAQRVVSNLSFYLPEDKFEKYIIVYDAKTKDYPNKGNLIDLKTSVIKNPLGKIINFIIRLCKIRRIKKRHKIDTTISLLSSPNILNIFTKQNDKIIISVRNFLSKSNVGFYGKFNSLLTKLLYNKADLIVVVSEAIKHDLINNFGLDVNKIKVIYNPYDIEKIHELAVQSIDEEYKEIFSKPTIITVGRLSKQKGQWHLIRAFKKVKEDVPNAQLVILGKGDLHNYLYELAVGLGLEKDIHFLGFQKNPFKFIARSTLYVFPSLYEGFPNALCEAMACGTPVIAADCKSGPREILAPDSDINIETKDIGHEKYGILVPVCDGKMYDYVHKQTSQEKMLSISIVELMENEDILKKYSAQSLNRVKDFNKENIIKTWEKEI